MNITRKFSPYVVTCAIGQLVGELGYLGNEVRVSDIAAFLGCTKATARVYIKRAIVGGKIAQEDKYYRSNRTMYTYILGESGERLFGCKNWVASKEAILIARGIINE